MTFVTKGKEIIIPTILPLSRQKISLAVLIDVRLPVSVDQNRLDSFFPKRCIFKNEASYKEQYQDNQNKQNIPFYFGNDI